MDQPPALNPEMVQEFVAVAHGHFGRVKTLLEHEPALISASWDWGGGDWETALGAAAHTGQREVALYLLQNGARLDLFAAAMLGELKIVQAVIEAFPGALHIPGPHGIPLITHAVMGGERAKAVLEYLRSLQGT